jgi:hypothetical protein
MIFRKGRVVWTPSVMSWIRSLVALAFLSFSAQSAYGQILYLACGSGYLEVDLSRQVIYWANVNDPGGGKEISEGTKFSGNQTWHVNINSGSITMHTSLDPTGQTLFEVTINRFTGELTEVQNDLDGTRRVVFTEACHSTAPRKRAF